MTVKARHSTSRQSTQDCNKPPTFVRQSHQISTSTALRFGTWTGPCWMEKGLAFQVLLITSSHFPHSSTCQPVVFHRRSPSRLGSWFCTHAQRTTATWRSTITINSTRARKPVRLPSPKADVPEAAAKVDKTTTKGNNADQVLLRGRCDMRWGRSACPSKETHGCCELLMFTMHKCRR